MESEVGKVLRKLLLFHRVSSFLKGAEVTRRPIIGEELRARGSNSSRTSCQLCHPQQSPLLFGASPSSSVKWGQEYLHLKELQ